MPARGMLFALALCALLAVTARAQESNAVSGNVAKNMGEVATNRTADAPESSARSTSSLTAAVQAPEKKKPHTPNLLLDFAEDQRALWTAPAQLRFRDTTWLVPLSGLTAGLFVTDSSFSRHLSHDPITLSHYSTVSNAGVAALVGGAGGMWVLSHFNHNAHWRETGFLAGEAALSSLTMTEALKYSFRRERPYQGDGTGPFFQSGGTSFPSEHAAAAWSVASVVAHEYPGPLTKLLAYGAASLVSYSRVRGEKHFPSDVVVGALLGELAAHEVYKLHHDPDLGGDSWSDPARIFFDDGHPRAGFAGSPYVPLDSWVYPALDRLAAMGLIDSGFAGMKPWTRLECARLVNEAQDQLADSGSQSDLAASLISSLEREFHSEAEGPSAMNNGTVQLESLYSRAEYISGKPLTDGFNFGQTQINDFGRPYGEGFNSVTGFSAYTTWGPWVGYVRGEWQTAPSVPALPLSARQFVATADAIPSLPPATASPSIQQFDLLEAYTGITFDNWEVSFGKQMLDWGPGEGGAMMLSDNAEPINMFRIDRVSPFAMPSLFKFLGPVRMEFFVGQLSGHHFVNTASSTVGSWLQPLNPQPFINGQKVSFRPSSNLEVGLTYGTIFGGVGVPATLHTFGQSLLDAGELPGGHSLSIRWTGLDFTYRIPRLRNWLTLYGDGFAEDQFVFFIDQTARPLPFGYPDRAAWRAGIYVAKFPRLSRLDFRAEGVYTDNPNTGNSGNISDGYYYSGTRYLNGFTNKGFLLGNWVGRQGQGAQAWTNYWFSPRNRVQVNFRHQKVSQEFIPGGGTLTDAGVRADYWLRSNLGLSASVQYEKWLFPVIQPGAERNLTGTIEIQFHPQSLFSSSMFHLAPKAASGDAQ
jgi:membrane-associated phospholipid phosphatase